MALSRTLICTLLLIALLHCVQSQNKPPKITEPEASQTFDVSSSDDTPVVLQCKAEGEPKPQYRWEFNGDPAEGVAFASDPITGTLTITGFTDREEGSYQCFAENEISTGIIAAAMSPVITLREIKMGDSWPDPLIREPKVNEGFYLKLECENQPVSVPTAQYTWYFVSGSETQGDIKNSDRIYTDNSGSLHFMYTLKEDQQSDKTYKCGMFNSKLNIIKLGSEKDIIVTSGDSVPQVPAGAQFHTNPAVFLRTQDAELECVFSGNPVPSITWYNKSGKLITANNKYEYVADTEGRKLRIKNVQEEDEGMYKCKGSNSAGSSETSLFMDITSGPIWVQALSSQTIPEKRDAVFTCIARPAKGETALSPPVWFRNGVPMPIQNSPKYEFSDNARVLTVKNLTKATDVMCFQCNVSNNIGYEFGDACLNVIEPIVILSEPSLRKKLRGDIVNLTVTGKTDPAYVLKYRWRFGNVTYELTSPPHVIYNETTQTAYINTTNLSDEDYDKINGTYYRDLYHPFETKTVAIDVIVTELPVIVPGPVVAAGMDLWWIALIVALIILIIVIILITIICNRKRQEGTYPLDKKERANDIDPEKDLADSGFHDLSRAPGDDDFPSKKAGGLNPNFDYGDDMDMGDDDESLMEYGGGDFDTTKFNEDGSFIGQYSSKNKTPEVTQSPMPLNHNATESQI
ncbi:LOW QUALITY PROTEIN: neuroglian-like [Haliotis rubra]|uniref:LOW QUALITY PROTEIN: neuroglian-like n=1 Tax=Haliotis rubra TaxID=36100 RepID=UPI001EE51652|nr:LOW QUALITY PROTEIN: neuroglian-like [Haliotis rubra]